MVKSSRKRKGQTKKQIIDKLILNFIPLTPKGMSGKVPQVFSKKMARSFLMRAKKSQLEKLLVDIQAGTYGTQVAPLWFGGLPPVQGNIYVTGPGNIPTRLTSRSRVISSSPSLPSRVKTKSKRIHSANPTIQLATKILNLGTKAKVKEIRSALIGLGVVVGQTRKKKADLLKMLKDLLSRLKVSSVRSAKKSRKVRKSVKKIVSSPKVKSSQILLHGTVAQKKRYCRSLGLIYDIRTGKCRPSKRVKKSRKIKVKKSRKTQKSSKKSSMITPGAQIKMFYDSSNLSPNLDTLFDQYEDFFMRRLYEAKLSKNIRPKGKIVLNNSGSAITYPAESLVTPSGLIRPFDLSAKADALARNSFNEAYQGSMTETPELLEQEKIINLIYDFIAYLVNFDIVGRYGGLTAHRYCGRFNKHISRFILAL